MANPAAVALGKLRAKTMTFEERSSAAKSYWSRLTAEEKAAEIARRIVVRERNRKLRAPSNGRSKKSRKLKKTA